jgi:hypothetical protein
LKTSRRIRLWSLAIALCVPAFAQNMGTGRTIPIKIRPAPQFQSFTGRVQLFTHSAITVMDMRNRYLLRTFTFTPTLRERLMERHLEFGDRVRVIYLIQGGQAVRLRCRLRKGS